MRKVTMIIGEPAVGKSTIMREFMSRMGNWIFEQPKWVPHHVHMKNGKRVIVLGRYDDKTHQFPGTDRMSMACQEHVIQFIMKNDDADILFEGDRLGNDLMVKHMQHAVGLSFEVIQICTTPEILAQRRATRNQSAQFLRSRKTKIENMTAPHGRCGRTGQMITRLFNHSREDSYRIAGYLMENRIS